MPSIWYPIRPNRSECALCQRFTMLEVQLFEIFEQTLARLT